MTGPVTVLDRPVPLLPSAAIAFLERWLRHDMHVLEYGSGASTLWFYRNLTAAGVLVSVEHSLKWHVDVSRAIAAEETRSNPYPHLIHAKRPYAHESRGIHPHLVLIDGRDRVLCNERARKIIRPGGIIMLDNSERAERYADIFKRNEDMERFDAVQVDRDRYGFYPTEGEWQCTWWKAPEKG